MTTTEHPEQENIAIEQLEEIYKKTHQFKYRQRVGQINAQLQQMSFERRGR